MIIPKRKGSNKNEDIKAVSHAVKVQALYSLPVGDRNGRPYGSGFRLLNAPLAILRGQERIDTVRNNAEAIGSTPGRHVGKRSGPAGRQKTKPDF